MFPTAKNSTTRHNGGLTMTHSTTRRIHRRLGLGLALVLGAAALPGVQALADTVAQRVLDTHGQVLGGTNPPAPLQKVTGISCLASTGGCDLWARTGSVTIPGTGAVPVWGYATNNSSPLSLPGPVIEATSGQHLIIRLHNQLAVATSLSIPRIPADAFTLTGNPASVAPAGTGTYDFNAGVIGTHIYQAGPTPSGNRQVAMGLAGVLIVRPATCPALAAGCAYGSPASSANDVFHDEALVALNEIDPAFAANPLGFEMMKFAPTIHLLNGKVFPETNVIDTQPGHKVLLRYANLGPAEKTMGLIGKHQMLIGRNGTRAAHPEDAVTAFVTPGETADAMVSMPVGAVAGQRYALYDQSRNVSNPNGTGFGGAITFLNVWGPAGVPGQPVANLSPFTPTDVVTGATGITLRGQVPPGTVAGLYFIDSIPNPKPIPPGQVVPWLTLPSCPATATAPCPFTSPIGYPALAPLANGTHVVWVMLTKAAVNVNPNLMAWGQPVGIAFTLDRGGPVMSATTLTPATTNGKSEVVLHTTADSTVTGTTSVVEGRYSVGGTCAAVETPAGLLLAQNPAGDPAPVVAYTTTIAPAQLTSLAEGPHQVYVAAKDALGHWSNDGVNPLPAPQCNHVSLNIDKTAPATSAVAFEPGAVTDGVTALPGSTAFLDSIRLVATGIDPVSATVNANVVAIEGFIEGGVIGDNGLPVDLATALTTPCLGGAPAPRCVGKPNGTLPLDGTGFSFIPNDGAYDSTAESGHVDIPLATVRALTPGVHKVWVHAKDAAGNWGALTTTGTLTLTYQPSAPQMSTLSYNGTTLVAGATSATAGVNITEIRYSVGLSAPVNPATGTLIPVTTPLHTVTVSTLIPVPPVGHNVFVAAKDSTGSWSPIVSLATITGLSYSGGNLQGTANSSFGTINQIERSSGATPAAPGTGTVVAATSAPSPSTFSVAVTLPATTGQTVWVRAQDGFGSWGPAVALPRVTGVGYVPGSLTGTATAFGGVTAIAALEYSTGAVAAAPGSGTALVTSGPSPLHFNVAATLPTGTAWVRARDSIGSWSPAVSIVVP